MSYTPDETERREKFVHHVRYFDSATRYPSPYIGFTGEPGYQFAHHCLPYDAAGFLNLEAAAPRTDPHEIRIFVVGDSTMLAGTEWRDLVPGRIHGLLQATVSPRINVFNFGAVSSCTEQMCALIWNRLLDLDPDMLVVISGGTDAFQPFTFDPRPGQPYNAFIQEFLYTHFFDERNDKSWQSSLNYDGVIDAAFDLRARIRDKVGYGSAQWEMNVARSYTGSLIKLVRLARAVAIPIFYFLEPIVVRKQALEASETNLASPEALAYLARQYDRFGASLIDLRARNLPSNLHLMDASRVFDNNGPGSFYDIVHYDSPGRTTVGQYLADQVREAAETCSARRSRGSRRGWMRGLLGGNARSGKAG